MRTGNKGDGIALGWKESRFDLVDYRNVQYRGREDRCLMDRDNVGLLAALRRKDTGETFLVCTTHLLFNYNRGEI
jgi:hypothetical protein